MGDGNFIVMTYGPVGLADGGLSKVTVEVSSFGGSVGFRLPIQTLSGRAGVGTVAKILFSISLIFARLISAIGLIH